MPGLVKDATKNDLTYRIIGAAMAVHNALGSGLKEEVYEKAMEAELNQRQIAAQRQYPVDIVHAGVQVGIFYLDLFVENQVVVEIKAFSHQLTNDELAQVINYLRAAKAQVGLLINFGRRQLDFRRVFPGPNRENDIQRVGRDNIVKR